MDNIRDKFKTKNNSGITLIALVVTIIVLIILAGVSINLLLGQYGVVTRAKNAAEATEVARVKEQIQLKLLDLETEKMLTNGSVTEDELKAIIEVAGGEVVTDEDGNITGIKVGNTTIPIEEITEGTTIKDEEETLKTDANGVVEGQSGYLGSGYDDPYIPVGFNHTAGTWNSGYTIKDSLNNVFVWVPCVTDQNKVKTGDTVETFEKTLPTTTATTDEYYMYNKNNVIITGDESPAEEIRTSVGTYGGFYIAAYEAGVPVNEDGTTEIAATSATTTQKARSVAGATAWTNISRTNAITAAANMIDSSVAGVNSGLISGECWDTTLQWMVNSSEKAANEPNTGYDTDSIGNGWYSDVSNSVKTTTGQYPINNIYDMAGNVWEWTTENCTNNGNSYLVNRGGSYDYSGSGYPAAYRNNCNDSAYSYFSFRVVLYK